ncbi:MFS transporter [Amycolatopsis sp. A1MSW2902]|uniref:MFS transporter n=1 Tax=Amycolatopsis sp. A1MSW2902 TaxID=687413 RepID=UPI00307D708F
MASSPKQPDTKASGRDIFQVAAVSIAANSIEYYDFFIYGTAAALVFPTLFFPGQSATMGVLLSFATLGVGFLARPLGGVVFGHFGDIVGRKKTLVIAMMLMGTVSTLIGVLPTYSSIGVAAPILLVMLRFLQGFSLGGQMGGVVLFAVEKAPASRRGLYGSLTALGSPGGTLVANGAFIAVTAALSPQALTSWGWRVPFLASMLLVGLALYLHFRIEETPAFRRLQEADLAKVAAAASARPTRSPVLTALRTYPREIALTAGTYLGINMTYYMLIAFVITYGTNPKFLGLPKETLLIAVLIGSTAQFIGLPAAGALSDRVGRRRVIMAGAGGLAVFSLAFWPMVDSDSFWMIALAMFIAMGLLHSLMYGVQPALFAETFSTEARYSGVSLGIQFGAVLGGAFAPMIATVLLSKFGSISIGIYMAVCCLVTLLSVWKLKETSKVESLSELSCA